MAADFARKAGETVAVIFGRQHLGSRARRQELIQISKTLVYLVVRQAFSLN
jgi:hypothetical protein